MAAGLLVLLVLSSGSDVSWLLRQCRPSPSRYTKKTNGAATTNPGGPECLKWVRERG